MLFTNLQKSYINNIIDKTKNNQTIFSITNKIRVQPQVQVQVQTQSQSQSQAQLQAQVQPQPKK